VAINITTAGAAGEHFFRKVNVNSEANYIYFKNSDIPAQLVDGAAYAYNDGSGSVDGFSNNSLVYPIRDSEEILKLQNASGEDLDITGSENGTILLNTPVVSGNILQIGSSTASNQAVKYYTSSTPLTGLTSGSTYFLKNVTDTFSGTQALYTLASNTHTFTTCGKTGRVGPDNSEILAGYSTTWHGVYLRQGDFTGYQDWTVPVSGTYKFTVAGASGYNGTGVGGVGRGAIVSGSVALTKGETITIAVGQVGSAPRSANIYGGSGGGSFVVRKSGNQPLLVAGGGTAESNAGAGRDGVLTRLAGTSTSGATSGGGIGSGGVSSGGRSAAGGGFTTAGQDGPEGDLGGGSFLNGLTMGENVRGGGYGGFGGGGSSEQNLTGQAGGAGGYSGGGGARSFTSGHSGGGGGSFIISSATAVGTSTGTFDGASTFNGVAITNAGYNTGEGSVRVDLVAPFTLGNEVYPTAADANAGTNKIAVAAAGSSYHAFVPINFDLENNQINTTTAHGFSNGEAVSPIFAGTAPAGLTSGATYYVNRVNNFSYKLSSTPAPNMGVIDFTTPSSRASSNSIARVIVNTVADTITINEHGFLVDQPLTYSAGGGTPILPLTDAATVYVSEVIDSNTIRIKNSLLASSINLTGIGTGTAHSFLFQTVNIIDDTLYIPNHGLVSGQPIRYTNGAGTIIGGLTNNATYFVGVVNQSLIRLYPTPVITGPTAVPVDITSAGTGTHSLTLTSLDFVNNIISISNHGFEQGELVEYDSRGQTVVNGLTASSPYYVVVVDSNNIKLATTPENAALAAAWPAGVAAAPTTLVVDITDNPAGVGVHSLKSLARTPDGIYEITGTPTARTFDVTAKGQVPLIIKTFNPSSAIDLNLNMIRINSHGFLTGTKVLYEIGPSATAIGGLTDNTEYYVVSINRDYIKLSESLEDSSSGTTIDLTSFATGISHSLTTSQINGDITGAGTVSVVANSVLVNGQATSFAKVLKVGDNFRLFPANQVKTVNFSASNVNTSNSIITTPTNTFVTGETVVFNNGGGTSPAPLVTGYYYFVRAISPTQVTLHSSKSNAEDDISPISFSTQGVGVGVFSLTNTVPVQPVIRKITAIGSDTQITVDRPYASAYNNVSYSYPTFIYVRPQGYSLHRPFDGGVEMSAGSGTSLAQIIRQTRKYFRYQSGKGLQTSCGINFKPSIDLESMTRFAPRVIECKTRRPHGLKDGLTVQISQAENSNGGPSSIYNGEFIVEVVNPTTFRIPTNVDIPEEDENNSYGFPQFHVDNWENGAVRTGMFDSQNGAFFEFDGQKLYAVRRSSTQQISGTVSVQQGSEQVFGTNTKFNSQLAVGDMIVLRGQSYRVVEIEDDNNLSIRPEYKGSPGVEQEFDPGNGTTGVVRQSPDNTFNLINHGFSNGLPVTYNSVDGQPIGGLVNGRTYYVDLINNNNFKLKATPDPESPVVELSSVGTTNVHSFVPAKSGIIVTKTVDTRVAQEDWNIDKADGTGPTGYNLDLSRIQMAYIDYSWYGAGKVRFGFKTQDGQVKYLHEFVHNNLMYEAYFRSGNLPARYEVVTYDNPTYIPTLFHWGTSVIMDGRFDDDNAYLFTANSQTLNVPGTTAKSFASTGINTNTDLFTVQTHGFRTGEVLQFQSLAANGLPGNNLQHPATMVIGKQTFPNLTNNARYKAFVNSPNLIHLTPLDATITVGATATRSGGNVTITTATPHGITSTPTTSSNNVGVYGIATAAGAAITDLPSFYVGPVTVTSTTQFTFPVSGSATISSPVALPNAAIAEVLNFDNQGNTQYTYYLYPEGSLNNSSGRNYQPLISLRLSPSVSEGLTGRLGDRDIINRMQLRLQEIGVSTTQLVDVKVMLNGRLNNLNFTSVDNPSLTQIVEHTAADTISGGIQVYNFRAAGGANGAEDTTSVDVSTLFELSNSILGGDSIFPDGPDILTIAVSRLTGNDTLTAAKLSWAEAQA
jgi:hypothetical protein